MKNIDTTVGSVAMDMLAIACHRLPLLAIACHCLPILPQMHHALCHGRFAAKAASSSPHAYAAETESSKDSGEDGEVSA